MKHWSLHGRTNMAHIRSILSVVAVVGALLVTSELSQAQQVTISVPGQSISDDFFEYVGGDWSLMGPGYFATFGGLAGPPFGGFDPNIGLSTGFSIGDDGRNARFRATAGTARSTTVVSETPMLTVTNGIPGFFFAGEVRPFVLGYIPTIGPPASPNLNNLGAANTINGRMQRGEFHVRNGKVVAGPAPGLNLPPELAAKPFLFQPPQPPRNPGEESAEEKAAVIRALQRSRSQSSIRSQSTEAKSSQAAEYIEKADKLVADGKPGAAKLLYQVALNHADGEQRQVIESKLAALAK